MCFGASAQSQSRDIEERARKAIADKQARKQTMEKKMREEVERLKRLLSYSIDDLQLAMAVKVRELYDGAKVMSDESRPTFLGAITDEFDPDSIFNDYGLHGSQFAVESIWNNFSLYGGQFAIASPF